MEHAPKSPEDLVSLADAAREAELKAQTEQREADFLDAHLVLASALSAVHWDALGVDPDAAEQDGTRVRVCSSFSYGGEDWSFCRRADMPEELRQRTRRLVEEASTKATGAGSTILEEG